MGNPAQYGGTAYKEHTAPTKYQSNGKRVAPGRIYSTLDVSGAAQPLRKPGTFGPLALWRRVRSIGEYDLERTR